MLNELKQCDYIIHAGDIVDNKNIGASNKQLQRYLLVKGNNDKLSLNEEELF